MTPGEGASKQQGESMTRCIQDPPGSKVCAWTKVLRPWLGLPRKQRTSQHGATSLRSPVPCPLHCHSPPPMPSPQDALPLPGSLPVNPQNTRPSPSCVLPGQTPGFRAALGPPLDLPSSCSPYLRAHSTLDHNGLHGLVTSGLGPKLGMVLLKEVTGEKKDD